MLQLLLWQNLRKATWEISKVPVLSVDITFIQYSISHMVYHRESLASFSLNPSSEMRQGKWHLYSCNLCTKAHLFLKWLLTDLSLIWQMTICRKEMGISGIGVLLQGQENNLLDVFLFMLVLLCFHGKSMLAPLTVASTLCTWLILDSDSISVRASMATGHAFRPCSQASASFISAVVLIFHLHLQKDMSQLFPSLRRTPTLSVPP